MNRLCQITGLSRAGYYRFRGRHNSRQGDMTLRNQIHIAHFAAGIQRSAVANSRISLRKNSKPIFRLPLSLGLDRE